MFRRQRRGRQQQPEAGKGSMESLVLYLTEHENCLTLKGGDGGKAFLLEHVAEFNIYF